MGTAMVSKPRRPDRQPIEIVRIGLAVALGLLLAHAVVVISVAGFARARNAQLAEDIASFDADAKAERAYALLGQNDPRLTPVAERLAKEALARSPLSVGAARTLALSYDLLGRNTAARSAFVYAEQLSRRDFATQAWLIEDRVAADDVSGALVHMDRALRTSKLAPNVIMPVLVGAIDDPRLIDPIAKLLASNPPWRASYLAQVASQSKNLPAAMQLAVRAHDRLTVQGVLARAVDNKQPELALRAYRAFGGNPSSVVGSLKDSWTAPPASWQLYDNAAIVTERTAEGSIRFTGPTDATADIARRLVSLPPGNYVATLTGAASGVPGSNAGLTILCYNSGSAATRIELPTKAGHQSSVFKIAPDCNIQWLQIFAPTSTTGSAIEGQIDALDIVRKG